MLQDIRKILTHGNWRSIVDWHRCIHMILTRTLVWKQRYMTGPLDYSSAVNRLRYIITTLSDDIPYMLKMPTDDDRYLRGVSPLINGIKGSIDPIYNNSTPKNLFCDRSLGKDIIELIVQTEYKYPLSMLPMDKPYPEWASVKPVRIWYHNSTELVHRLEPHAVTFKYDVPTEMVIAIDLHAYVMKYLKYCQQNGGVHSVELVDQYIHNEIIPNWFDDLLRIWTMNIMIRYLDDPSFKTVAIQTFGQHAHYLLSDNNLSQAFEDLEGELTLLKKHNIRPEDFLNTQWFGNHQSLLTIMDELDTVLASPTQYQHLGSVMMLYFPILKIVLKVCNLYKSPTSDRIAKLVRNNLYRLRFANSSANIRNQTIRDAFQKDLDELTALVNEMVNDMSGIHTPSNFTVPSPSAPQDVEGS